MKFGGIGLPELLIILVVVLLIFGPKNLPKLGSAIGRTVKNLREGMDSAPDIKVDEEEETGEVEEDDDDDEVESEAPKKVRRKKKPAAEETEE